MGVMLVAADLVPVRKGRFRTAIRLSLPGADSGGESLSTFSMTLNKGVFGTCPGSPARIRATVGLTAGVNLTRTLIRLCARRT
jgi:hypothetical protein